MKLQLRVFDVPLHPLLVHFPIAFWLVVPMLDIAASSYVGYCSAIRRARPLVDSGPGRNNPWHRNRRRFHRGGLARIPSAFACRHRSETSCTAWNQDISGMVHIHCKDRGSIALANCWVVNDLVSCFRPHWLCIACPRRLFRHAAGLPATRGGIATWIGKPTSTPREPEPTVNWLAVIPAIAHLRLRKRANRFTTSRRESPLPQVLRRRQPLV
jgi:hypothetical protein